jgi:YbbR domain-containing protein
MDKDGKQQFIIKTTCVIAAFVLWLFITSTENPVNAYWLKHIPVQLMNTDVLTRSNLILVPGQEFNIDINIKGASTSTLMAKTAEDFTIVADLSAYALKSGEQKIPIEIRRSPDNINVANSDNLFIKVNLDERMETRLPIKISVTGKPKEGFYASLPILSQTSATVIGGAKLVSLVKQVLVEEDIKGLESDVTKNYKLKPVDVAGKEIKEVTVSPSHIDIKIPIRKTKSLGVSVKTKENLNSKFTIASIKVLPERIDVTGSALALDLVGNLNTETIDLSEVNKNTTVEVKVVLPEGLSFVDPKNNGMVKVEINLSTIILKNLSLDIKHINLDEKYDVKLEKLKSSVTVSGTQAIIDSLDLKKVSATVDLANLVEGEHTIKVLVTIPEGVNLISQELEKILVTITKKQTEGTTTNDNKTE